MVYTPTHTCAYFMDPGRFAGVGRSVRNSADWGFVCARIRFIRLFVFLSAFSANGFPFAALYSLHTPRFGSSGASSPSATPFLAALLSVKCVYVSKGVGTAPESRRLKKLPFVRVSLGLGRGAEKFTITSGPFRSVRRTRANCQDTSRWTGSFS